MAEFNEEQFALAVALAKSGGGGGGGADSLTDLSDVSISSPQGGECLKYNATSGKWENGDDAGNVQSDWNENDPTSGAYILNKPSIPSKTSDLTNDSGFQSVKVLTDTLNAGQTTLTFTDSAITTSSLIDVYAPVWYSDAVQSNGSVVLTFPVQSSDMVVKIKVG